MCLIKNAMLWGFHLSSTGSLNKTFLIVSYNLIYVFGFSGLSLKHKRLTTVKNGFRQNTFFEHHYIFRGLVHNFWQTCLGLRLPTFGSDPSRLSESVGFFFSLLHRRTGLNSLNRKKAAPIPTEKNQVSLQFKYENLIHSFQSANQ